jgi:hypothetical protein
VEQASTSGPVELLLVVVSDKPAVRQVAESLAGRSDTPSIEVTVVQDVRMLNVAANRMLEYCGGEFVLVMDGDCVLAEGALAKFVAAHAADIESALVYSDHDELTTDGKQRVNPFFKPDYSPELLHSFNYLGPVILIRRELLRSIGAFAALDERAHVYDIALRALEIMPRACHVREVLYHRTTPSRKRLLQPGSSVEALSRAIARRGLQALARSVPRDRTRMKFRTIGKPVVSIIIPSDDADNSIHCIRNCALRPVRPALQFFSEVQCRRRGRSWIVLRLL